MVAKVFKNEWESSWDATLNKPVPWLIRILVSRRPGSIALLSWSSYTKEFACKLDFHCTRLARAGELSKLDTGIMIISYSTYQFKSLKDRLLEKPLTMQTRMSKLQLSTAQTNSLTISYNSHATDWKNATNK